MPRCDRREQIAIPLCSTKSKSLPITAGFLVSEREPDAGQQSVRHAEDGDVRRIVHVEEPLEGPSPLAVVGAQQQTGGSIAQGVQQRRQDGEASRDKLDQRRQTEPRHRQR